MESTVGDLIQPEGWMPWAGTFALDTLWYAEFANRGPRTVTNGMVEGLPGCDRATVEKFATGPFLQGDTWLGTIRYSLLPLLEHIMKTGCEDVWMVTFSLLAFTTNMSACLQLL